MTNEPRTQAGRALDAALEEAYGPNPDATQAILAIEAEAAAAPAALLELAEQYHSGHSVTGSPCRCRQCKQLAKLRKRRSEPAAAEPPALALLERWLYSGSMTRPDLDALTVDTTLFLDRERAAQPPPLCPECGATYGR